MTRRFTIKKTEFIYSLEAKFQKLTPIFKK